MRYSIISVIVFSVLCRVCYGLRVRTTIGTINGKFERFGERGVHKFLGIPYAEPPVENLRFKPPVPKRRFHETLEADRTGPMCPQDEVQARFFNFTDDPDSVSTSSEDCLYLNIYVPTSGVNGAIQRPSKAVMFYIHSGGWTWGSAGHYDGRWLAIRGDVIVVTFNYRLGILGFLKTENRQIVNNGFRDQILAFKWIYDNIAGFGGDPGLITVFGHSAGGVGSIQLQAVPELRGTIRRVMSLAGLPSPIWSTYLLLEKRNLTRHIVEVSGCDDSNYVECLTGKSVQELVQITTATTKSMKILTAWMPWPDSTLIDQMKGMYQSKFVEDGFEYVDFMGGMETSDGTSMAMHMGEILGIEIKDELTFEEIGDMCLLRDLVPDADSVLRDMVEEGERNMSLRSAVDFMTDYASWYPLYDTARTHDRVTGDQRRTYVFTNDYVAKDRRGLFPRPEWQKRAVHGDELPLIFGSLLSPIRGSSSREDIDMAEAVITYITNFVKTGNPNDPATVNATWMEFTRSQPRKLHISEQGMNDTRFTLLMKSTDYWDRLYGFNTTNNNNLNVSS